MLNNKKNGFTLLEVMIAVTILAVSAVGLVSLLTYTVSNVTSNTNQLIAVNLAQEGLEAARHTRDKTTDWRTWYDNQFVTGYYYRAQMQMIAPYSPYEWILDPRTGSAPADFYQLYYNSATGIYRHGGFGDPTIFYRRIECYPVGGTGDEALILSHIWWDEHGQQYDFAVSDLLYNWQQ